MNNEELMHYGVIGMKWGVHKGNASKAYGKAIRKKTKLENNVVKTKKAYDKATIKANTGAAHKYQNLQIKADKLQSKADKKKYGFFSNARKAAELQVKADRAQYKANKYKSKYDKGQSNQSSAKAKYLRAQRKAEKWVKAMDKVFKNYNINDLTSENINSGKEFVNKFL